MSDTAATPACHIDLSCWNWTSPVGAKVTETAELNKRIGNAFLIHNPDGSITFRAPSSGEGIKSTKNSTFPRSELRETLANGDDKEANWKPVRTVLLDATLIVNELAASLKAILGQFHGKGTHPPLKIQITGDTIYAQLRKKLDGPEDKLVLLKGYKLGQELTYNVVYDAGLLDIWINGQKILMGYQFDLESYKNDTWYCKAGMYSQEKVGGKGEGRVTFKALKVTHYALAVPVPADTTVATQLKNLLIDNLAGNVVGKAAKAKLNALSTAIKAEPDVNQRTVLNALAAEIKRQLK
jgi:hypothetical protein